MKSVSFKSVGMKNFCCFKDEISLEFSGEKLVLITGPNGSGKTTLFDCIPFTLYGSTSKGLRSDDVVNVEVGKNCHTWLEFSVDGSNFRIDRYCKHSKMGNTVTVAKDGSIIKKGQTEVLPFVEELLVPQKLFMNTLLFSQKVRTFFTDLPDSEQKEIFRKVLQLDNFLLYYNTCNAELKRIENDLRTVEKDIEVKISLFEEAVGNITRTKHEKEQFYLKKKELLAQLSQKLVEKKAELESAKATLESFELEKLQKDLEVSTAKMASLSATLSQLKTELEKEQQKIIYDKNEAMSEVRRKAESTLKKNLEIKTEKVKELSKKATDSVKPLTERFSTLDKELSSLRTEMSVSGRQVQELEEKIAVFEEGLKGDIPVCAACKQPLKDATSLKAFLDNLKRDYEQLKAKTNYLPELFAQKSKEKQEVQTAISDLERAYNEELEALEKDYKEKEEEVESKLRKTLDELEEVARQKLETLSESFSEKESEVLRNIQNQELEEKRLRSVLQEAKIVQQKVVLLEKEVAIAEEQLRQKEQEEFDEEKITYWVDMKKNLENSICSLEQRKAEVEKEKNCIEFWKEGFSSSGIPSMLIDEAIPFMNSRISQYLEKIGGRYIVSFDTIGETKAGEFRDKITVRVLDVKTKADSRKKLSGGQTRIVDIATILTLSDLQSKVQDMKFNIMLFDEIFDSLDDENISYVSSLLRTLLEGKSIYIISHRHIDQIEADEVLRFY